MLSPICTSDRWNEKVEDLASRGLSLRQLLDFLCQLLRGELMENFEPRTTTTGRVVFQAVIPLTAKHGSDYSALVRQGVHCFPDKMVSHAWSNVFLDLVAAIVADAMGLEFYFHLTPQLQSLAGVEGLLRRMSEEALSRTYWICAFAVNQHISTCNTVSCNCGLPKYQGSDDEESEMNKFDDMLALLKEKRGDDFGQVIALGRHLKALSRCWVVAEIAECQRSGIPQSAITHFPISLSDPSLTKLVRNLDVERCEAREPADRLRILLKIHDKRDYNEKVRALLLTKLKADEQHKLTKIENAGIVLTFAFSALMLWQIIHLSELDAESYLLTIVCYSVFLSIFAYIALWAIALTWFRRTYERPILAKISGHSARLDAHKEIPIVGSCLHRLVLRGQLYHLHWLTMSLCECPLVIVMFVGPLAFWTGTIALIVVSAKS
eukprot:TRINITY_DN5634_c0_g2_i3.p1 TRINITY_DN5634_c0_g2~~TRINITY_DN5634_c0_g2_i3.p1  ORF type:complete len:453 (+),score=55.84 TRINITY_DN5634_c0_g2_i3:54-1361(+)